MPGLSTASPQTHYLQRLCQRNLFCLPVTYSEFWENFFRYRMFGNSLDILVLL